MNTANNNLWNFKRKAVCLFIWIFYLNVPCKTSIDTVHTVGWGGRGYKIRPPRKFFSMNLVIKMQFKTKLVYPPFEFFTTLWTPSDIIWKNIKDPIPWISRLCASMATSELDFASLTSKIFFKTYFPFFLYWIFPSFIISIFIQIFWPQFSVIVRFLSFVRPMHFSCYLSNWAALVQPFLSVSQKE